MKVPFTGGCVCGAIRYECSAEPIVMFNCGDCSSGDRRWSVIPGARCQHLLLKWNLRRPRPDAGGRPRREIAFSGVNCP